MSYNFQVEQRNLERAVGIRNSEQRPKRTAGPIRQRIADAAAALDRRGRLQSHLDLCIEATGALIELLYRTDDDGLLANVDRATGLILIPVPWSDAGSKKWGLRQWEARHLRAILLDRLHNPRRYPSPFDYADYSHRWYLDLATYPSAEHALQWLRRDAPSLAEWRTLVNERRAADAQRKAR